MKGSRQRPKSSCSAHLASVLVLGTSLVQLLTEKGSSAVIQSTAIVEFETWLYPLPTGPQMKRGLFRGTSLSRYSRDESSIVKFGK
jgi:hypothetical protein